MSFLGTIKREKVPNELPDLAIEGNAKGAASSVPESLPGSLPSIEQQDPPKLISEPPATPKLEDHHSLTVSIPENLKHEFSSAPSSDEKVEEKIKDALKSEGTSLKTEDNDGFFDKMLEDINGEIKDIGKLEDWYKNKFLPQDVVSNMRGYWEGNKADIIIKSFGEDYKRKIKEKIEKMQVLEADWREIYFKLIKKEEEMKKEERMLKDTLSEFVELCKRRKLDVNEEMKKEPTENEETKKEPEKKS